MGAEIDEDDSLRTAQLRASYLGTVPDNSFHEGSINVFCTSTEEFPRKFLCFRLPYSYR